MASAEARETPMLLKSLVTANVFVIGKIFSV